MKQSFLAVLMFTALMGDPGGDEATNETVEETTAQESVTEPTEVVDEVAAENEPAATEPAED